MSIEEKKYKCTEPNCGLAFATSQLRYYHMNTKHAGAKVDKKSEVLTLGKLPCEYCGRSYSSKESLRTHPCPTRPKKRFIDKSVNSHSFIEISSRSKSANAEGIMNKNSTSNNDN